MKTLMKKLSPNMMVKDVKKTVEFYEANLGFKLAMAVPSTQDGILTTIPEDKEVVYALVKNGAIEIMFQVEESLKKDIAAFADSQIGASVSFYFEVENLNAFYKHVKDNVEIVKDLATAWYGMNEFYIRDNNGYILGFAEQAQKK